MHIVKEGEITDSMYIVHTGRVRETCENSNRTRLYHSGENFGQVKLCKLVKDLKVQP